MPEDGQPAKKPSGPQHFLMVGGFALVALLIGYNLYSGLTLEEIGVPGVFTLKFKSHAQPASTNKTDQPADPFETDFPSEPATPPPQRVASGAPPKGMASEVSVKKMGQEAMHSRQVELEQRLRDMEEALKRAERGGAPRTSTAAKPARRVSLTGTWQSPEGLSYVIHQEGEDLTIQEVSPLYGVTAVGEGTIEGQKVEISYATAVGTMGKADLTLASSGKELTGTFKDLTTGASLPLTLRR